MNAQPGGQNEGNTQRSQPEDNDRLAEMVRRAMRGGLVNRDLEDVHRSPFTPTIRQARNPPNFKLRRWKCMMGGQIQRSI